MSGSDELTKAEAQLAEIQRELQLTIDTIPTLVVTFQPDGRRTFVNQTWRDYTGLTLQETMGEGRPYFHPDDLQRADNAWRASLANGEPFLIELRLRHRDGNYRWHTVRRVPLRDENGEIVRWYGVAFDIEEKKRAERALQRSEAYSAEAQKLSLTGSFSWEIAGGDGFWSDETFQIMGFDRSVKPSIDQIIRRVHPDDRALAQHELNRAVQGVPSHDHELRLLMPDGQIKHVHVRARRVRYESGKEEIVGALMDITEAKRSQEALQAAQAALAHASRVATLGEITATIAHEVNQPLAAIMTNGETGLRWLARPEPDLEKVRELTKRVVADARRASEIVDRIRAMAARRAPEQTLLSLEDVIEESMLFLRHEFQSKSISVSLDLAHALPRVVGDRTQLQQVVVNLALNAVQAVAQSDAVRRGIFIRTMLSEPETVCCNIEDSGPGIDPTHIPRLFDGFFTTKDTGMGMGLRIARSIIEAHNGQIRADNKSALGGARFIFTLPSSGAPAD